MQIKKRRAFRHNMGGPALGVNDGLAFGPIPESVKNRQRRVEAFVVTSRYSQLFIYLRCS